jgi:predicted  nucleic acid-binding Zn-ribbon protein
MNESHFSYFIELINFDRAVNVLRASAQVIEKDIVALQKELHQDEQAVEKAHRTAHDLRKEVDAKELAMRELDEAEKLARTRLETVENSKEYHAIKAEIERLRDEQRTYEEILLGAWAQLDSAQGAYDRAKKQYEIKKEALSHTLVEKQQAMDVILQDIQSREPQRTALEGLVPAEWFTHYSRMRESVSDPVAGVKDGCCDACYYTINKQDLGRLEHHAMLTCKGCYRLLYIQPPQS